MQVSVMLRYNDRISASVAHKKEFKLGRDEGKWKIFAEDIDFKSLDLLQEKTDGSAPPVAASALAAAPVHPTAPAQAPPARGAAPIAAVPGSNNAPKRRSGPMAAVPETTPNSNQQRADGKRQNKRPKKLDE